MPPSPSASPARRDDDAADAGQALQDITDNANQFMLRQAMQQAKVRQFWRRLLCRLDDVRSDGRAAATRRGVFARVASSDDPRLGRGVDAAGIGGFVRVRSRPD